MTTIEKEFEALLNGILEYRNGATLDTLVGHFVGVRPDLEGEGNLVGCGTSQIAPVPDDGGPPIGPWYHPQELALGLSFVEAHRPSAILDIGTGNGWTTALVAAVAQHHNPNARVVSCDPDDSQQRSLLHEVVRQAELRIQFVKGTANEARKHGPFGMVMFDGAMNAYHQLKRDAMAAQDAPLLWVHDIANPFVGWENASKFWGEMVGERGVYHDSVRMHIPTLPDGQTRMGLGLLARALGGGGCKVCRK